MPMYEARLLGGPLGGEVILLNYYVTYLNFPTVTQEDLDSILIPHPDPQDKPISISRAKYHLTKHLPRGVLVFNYEGVTQCLSRTS